MCSEVAFVGPLSVKEPLCPRKMPFIYLDGGITHQSLIRRLGLEDSFLTIGDNDSYCGAEDEFDILLPRQKDQSDLAAALEELNNLCRESKEDGERGDPKLETLHLYGLLGGRLDHQLAIFGELFDFIEILAGSENFQSLFYSSHHNQVEAIIFQGALQREIHGTFSLMSLRETRVSAMGDLKYPLEHHGLKAFSSLALSNEGFGEVTIHCERPILLIMPKGV